MLCCIFVFIHFTVYKMVKMYMLQLLFYVKVLEEFSVACFSIEFYHILFVIILLINEC